MTGELLLTDVNVILADIARVDTLTLAVKMKRTPNSSEICAFIQYFTALACS
jgi:hypothetical protein